MELNYKQITQKEYLRILNEENNKSKIIFIYNDNESLFNCFYELEKVLSGTSEEELNDIYKSQKEEELKLISGDKKRLVFRTNYKFIYGFLSGEYYLFTYKGYSFIINVKKSFKNKEDRDKYNLDKYSIEVSFLF